MATSATMTTNPTGTVHSGVPFTILVSVSATDATALNLVNIQEHITPSGTNQDVASWGEGAFFINTALKTYPIPLSGTASVTYAADAVIYNTEQTGTQLYQVSVEVQDDSGAIVVPTPVVVTCSAYLLPA